MAMMAGEVIRFPAAAAVVALFLGACAGAPPPPPAPVIDRSQAEAERVRAEAEARAAEAAVAAEAAEAAAAVAGKAAVEAAEAAAEAAEAAVPTSSVFIPAETLVVCRGLRGRNAPPTNGDREVIGFKPFVNVQGQVALLANPARGACLTSGFGPRGGRTHKGIDYQARPADTVHAAGDGIVREAGYRNDYGNYFVIDHGSGVFTRYAHLANRAAGLTPGAKVAFGQTLGVMGDSAGFRIPLHLHYEILVGNYDTPKRSFGLRAVNPFDYDYVGEEVASSKSEPQPFDPLGG